MSKDVVAALLREDIDDSPEIDSSTLGDIPDLPSLVMRALEIVRQLFPKSLA